METISKKKDLMLAFKLRSIRLTQKPKRKEPQKIYRLPKLVNLDFIE